MRREIIGQDIDVSEALQTYVEQRLGFALSRFGGRIARVVVRLSVLNGVQGQAATRCSITVSLVHRGQALIEDADADVYRAIDRAVHRVTRTVQRKLQSAQARGH